MHCQRTRVDSKNPCKFALPVPHCLLCRPNIIPSASYNWGESQYHLNAIPSIHVWAVVSPAALLPLPKPSEQSCQGLGSAGPCRAPKGSEKAVMAKDILHLRNISLWEVLSIFPSPPLRSNGSIMELTRWRENLGSHPKSTKGAYMHRGFKGFKQPHPALSWAQDCLKPQQCLGKRRVFYP